MTLGVGVVVEEGACLLVDSCRGVHKPDGTIEETIVDDKLLLTEAATDRDLRLAVVHSGPSPIVRRPKSIPMDDDFFAAAESIWTALTRVRWADFVAAEHRTNFHELLVVGSRLGEPVTLIRMGSDTATRVADNGAVFAIGLGSGIWNPPRPVKTIADALSVGLEAFTTLMRQRLRHAAHLGEVAGVAWPATAALITPESVEVYEFAETPSGARF